MTEADIKSLIAAGEKLTVEFKGEEREPINDRILYENIVCLANSEGGTLLIGVEDDGHVTGPRPRHGTTTDPTKLQAAIFNNTDLSKIKPTLDTFMPRFTLKWLAGHAKFCSNPAQKIRLMRSPKWLRLTAVLFVACLSIASATAQALTTWKNCALVPAEWADGDSFQIQTPKGERHTIRLYGADCIEWHVSDDSDARRLRAQRRYFGISESGGSPLASIQAAKDLGEAAAKEVVSALKKPFQVHTAFADARGDGKFKRIYAFVTTAEGEDLAERLVRLGLARAFGVYRETPSGKSANDYRAYLQDVELQSAKRGVGAWAKTNWDRLPAERQAERQESDELAMAAGNAKLAPGAKINPNTAARDQLMLLPGVGEVTANRIIQARPFRKAEDLLNVEGIGPKTLEGLQPFLQLP